MAGTCRLDKRCRPSARETGSQCQQRSPCTCLEQRDRCTCLPGSRCTHPDHQCAGKCQRGNPDSQRGRCRGCGCQRCNRRNRFVTLLTDTCQLGSGSKRYVLLARICLSGNPYMPSCLCSERTCHLHSPCTSCPSCGSNSCTGPASKGCTDPEMRCRSRCGRNRRRM